MVYAEEKGSPRSAAEPDGVMLLPRVPRGERPAGAKPSQIAASLTPS